MTHFNPNTPWRRISTAIYSKPLDGRIFGTVELDVTELEDWVSRQRQEGLKITLMYPLLLLAAPLAASATEIGLQAGATTLPAISVSHTSNASIGIFMPSFTKSLREK